MVPHMVFPWTLQWYFNSPSLSNLTGVDVSPALIASVSNVLPSSSDVAVCIVKDLLLQTTESPMWTSSVLGSYPRLMTVTMIDRVSIFLPPSCSAAEQATDAIRINTWTTA